MLLRHIGATIEMDRSWPQRQDHRMLRMGWIDEPEGIDKAAFEAQVFGGLNAALQTFVVQQGFPAPAAQVAVAVKRISGPRTFGGVARCNPLIISNRPPSRSNHSEARIVPKQR